jgi:uncharacterized protein (TIGR03067 family)
MKTIVTAMTAVLFLAGAAGVGDRETLQGDWTTSAFFRDGGPLPAEKQYPDRLLTFKGDEWYEVRDGKVAVRGTFKLDPSKSPKWLDATFLEGGPGRETVKGIYALDGDVLTVCIGTPETPRPAKFESTPDSGLRLIVYQRQKSGPKASGE